MKRFFLFAVFFALLCSMNFLACDCAGGMNNEEASSEITSEHTSENTGELADTSREPTAEKIVEKTIEKMVDVVDAGEGVPERTTEPRIEKVAESVAEAQPQDTQCQYLMNAGGVCDPTYHYKIQNECVPKEFVDKKDWQDSSKLMQNYFFWSYVEFAWSQKCGYTRTISAIWFKCQESLACSDSLKCSDIKWFTFECHNVFGTNACDWSKYPAVHGVKVGDIYDEQRKLRYYYVLVPHPYDGAYPRSPAASSPNDYTKAVWWWPWKEPACNVNFENISMYNPREDQKNNPWMSLLIRVRCKAGKCDVF